MIKFVEKGSECLEQKIPFEKYLDYQIQIGAAIVTRGNCSFNAREIKDAVDMVLKENGVVVEI